MALLNTEAPADPTETSTALVGRRGRRAAPPANTGIARELRRRRELLRLSIREVGSVRGSST